MKQRAVTTETKALMVVSRAAGKSFRKIASEVGLSDKTVSAALREPEAAATVEAVRNNLTERFQQYGIDHTTIGDFKQDRADIFAGLQEKIAQTFTKDDLEKASARDRVIILGTLYDKERLERGQSTSNSSVFFQIVQESDQADD